ncbi:MAG: hypothetical protein R3240_03545, partial [Gammaproteobacteria bacterium]|nr:hypothetical protein [Gammaproteobacteria bacterium]
MSIKTPCSWALALVKRSPAIFLFLAVLFSSQVSAQWVKQVGLNATDINSLAIDSMNPNLIFVGTNENTLNPSQNGLYYSNNAGQTWTRANVSTVSGKGVRSISIAPGTAGQVSGSKVFAVINNQGIYKSVNGGLSWVAANIQSTTTQNGALTQFVSQVVAAGSAGFSQKVYAVVTADEIFAPNSAGIYYSSNDGQTWQKANFNIAQTVHKLVVPSTQPNTLYVLTVNNELMKSTDGGISFITASSGLPIGIGAQIVDFIVDPNNPSMLYASAIQNGARGIYKSTNGGMSWQIANSNYVFHKLAINKGSNATGITQLYGIYNEAPGATVPSFTVYTSVDGGTSWSKLETSTTTTQLSRQNLNVIEAVNGNGYVGGKVGFYTFSGTGSVTPGNGLNLTVSSNSQLIAGGTATFNLMLQNTSGQFLSNIAISTSAFPVGTVLNTFGTNSICTMQPTTAVISCNLNSLQVGGSQQIPISVTLPQNLTSTILPITFNATGGFIANASASYTLTQGGGNIGQGVSMNVTSNSILQAGGTATFNVNLQNTSGQTQSNIIVTTSAFPVGTSFNSFGSDSLCSMQTTTRVVICTVSSMFVNGTKQLPISVTLPFNLTTTSLPVSFNAGGGIGVNASTSYTLTSTGQGGQGVNMSVTS